MAPNTLLYEKNGAQRVQNHMKTFFGSHPKNGLHEKICAQKVAQNISWQKSFAHPNICLLLHLWASKLKQIIVL